MAHVVCEGFPPCGEEGPNKCLKGRRTGVRAVLDLGLRVQQGLCNAVKVTGGEGDGREFRASQVREDFDQDFIWNIGGGHRGPRVWFFCCW